mmetsp:Transcript_136696/g.241079  ORF Transcript_136696/g.241079 Transcript_136696/m.241079 type:complete len:117 (+) Transcript_136696:60-410(+)
MILNPEFRAAIVSNPVEDGDTESEDQNQRCKLAVNMTYLFSVDVALHLTDADGTKRDLKDMKALLEADTLSTAAFAEVGDIASSSTSGENVEPSDARSKQQLNDFECFQSEQLLLA